MSRYGLTTSTRYEHFVEFVRATAAPSRDIDFFSKVSWTSKYLSSESAYRPAPFYSRYGKPDTNDVFFSRTIASDDTIPHLLLLLRKEGWGSPQPAIPDDGKQRPFTAPTEPDSVLLVDLKEGLNGFEHTGHGGAMCALLDETLGMTVELHRQTSSTEGITNLFTASLNVSFLAPVRTPSVLKVQAWLLRREGRKWFLRAQIVDAEDKVLLEADSIWISAKPKSSL